MLEVGSGLGALTQELVKVAGQVIGLEIDKNFEPILGKLEKLNSNLKIYWQDILSLTDEQWQKVLLGNKNSDYKVIANIPYYLTGKLIPCLLAAKFLPTSMTLMLQKEVAERIIQKNNKHSLLSLSVALVAEARLVSIVTKDNFYPAPKIDSAIIHIDNIKSWPHQVSEKKFGS